MTHRHQNHRITRRTAGAALLAGLAAPSSWAQGSTFPDKAVKIIVPSVPGGLMDVSARLIGPKLSGYWGQPVLVENRAGAGMAIGSTMVAKAPADGYTLLLGHEGAIVINPLLVAETPYIAGDFAPLAQVWDTALLFMVNAELKVNTFAELDDLVKKNPGRFNWPVADTLSDLHAELLKQATGWKFQTVMYKGNAERSRSLMANETQFGFQSASEAVASLQTGRIKALAISSTQRTPKLPNIPTLDEVGLKGFALTSWGGMFAPAATPAPILAKLSADIRRALAEKDVLARLEENGTEVPHQLVPSQFAARIKADQARWKRIAEARGVKTYDR